MVPIPRSLIELCLRQLIPLTLEVGALFRQNAEENGLPPRINWWIEIYGVHGWAHRYLSADSMWTAHLEGVDGVQLEPLWQIDWSSVDTSNPDAIYAAIWRSVENALLTNALEPNVPESIEAEKDELAQMSPEDRETHVEGRRRLLTAALLIIHNYFACMAYKKSMFQLVAEAIKGNRKSFLKAVHVDSTCLDDIEWFKAAVNKAARSKTDNLVSLVQDWRQKPPLSSGVKLNGFNLAILFLNSLGVLEQFKADMDRFADLFQSLGIYGPPVEEDVVDVGSFSRALSRFESEHQAIHLIAPGQLIVKDTL